MNSAFIIHHSKFLKLLYLNKFLLLLLQMKLKCNTLRITTNKS